MTKEQLLELLRSPTPELLTRLFDAGARACDDDVAWSTEAIALELRELADIIEGR